MIVKRKDIFSRRIECLIRVVFQVLFNVNLYYLAPEIIHKLQAVVAGTIVARLIWEFYQTLIILIMIS